MTLADEVANVATRLQHLELKSEADDNLIVLLKEQNRIQASELAEVKHKHEDEIQALRQERDVAVRNAVEVSGLITTMGSMALAGIRKMRGDETPPPTTKPYVIDARLPKVEMPASVHA